MSYLAKAYRAGNMTNVIQHPEYTRRLKGVVVDDYTWLVAACCFAQPIPEDSDFTDSVITVITNRLLSNPSHDSTEWCLDGISKCSVEDFSGLNWNDLSLQLLSILKANLQNPDSKFLMKCFAAIGIFVGKHDSSRDEEIGSLYLETIDSAIDISRSALSSFLPNFPQFSLYNALFGKIHLIYQKMARSVQLDRKKFAENVAISSKIEKLKMFGYDAVNSSLLSSEDYQVHLERNLPPAFQVVEVIEVICEFANETYRTHQHIDVLDKKYRWCAAEIVEFAHPNVKVHYTGWSNRYDELIKFPSKRIAPAFTYTRLEPPSDIKQTAKTPLDAAGIKRLVSCDCLNLSSEEQVLRLHSIFDHVQSLINSARWTNSENLRDQI
eukprot:TRINITY_DN6048_c0_g1_i2.p1 TRINITY_DN6048_c0_g1~~TRINITY_DN6048_c0_g1_i2.p1  ORF type:complete len:381 (-),score=92.68 TRINITY_DN6048_c0_g1_i2:122-1264(-)